MQGLEGSRERGAGRSTVAQRRLVFEHTVEGLFRFSLRSRLSVQAWNGLRAVGIDLSKPLLPAYRYHFLTRSKPATHLRALANLDDSALKGGLPSCLHQLLERVKTLLRRD